MPKAKSKSLRTMTEADFQIEADASALERASEVLKDKDRLKKAKKYLADKAEEAQSAIDNIDGLRSK